MGMADIRSLSEVNGWALHPTRITVPYSGAVLFREHCIFATSCRRRKYRGKRQCYSALYLYTYIYIFIWEGFKK